MSGQTVINVDGVDCSYGSVPALAEVSLTVSVHEMCGVIGPNGSGKTTLLRAMDGLLSPNRGSVTLEGREIGTIPSRSVAAMVGIVPQRSGSGFGFTTHEMVSMGRSPHLTPLASDTGRDQEIVSTAMERTGITHLAFRPVDSLSGGEFQRVLIARALAQEPRVLLLDEPTAHLDLRYQVEIMDLLLTLCRSGLALVAALHDVNLAAEYCDRLVLLSSGRIVAMGTPQEVLETSTIERVYGIPVRVAKRLSSGRPYVLTTAIDHAAAEK